MDKTVSGVSQKRANKQPKNKKAQQQQQPLKVVYITNPIKFNATASEFRALVQELTGQDADSSRFAAADDGGQEELQAAVESVPAVVKGSDPSRSYEDDGICSTPVTMIDNFQGFAASSLWHGDDDDVFRSLGNFLMWR